MRAAGSLGIAAGTCDASEAANIEALICAYGLPLSAHFDPAVALERLKSDKKRVGGKQRYVLPLNGGGVVLRDDVPDAAAVEALDLVNQPVDVAQSG
jgi:3-dehydroquinate synthetase